MAKHPVRWEGNSRSVIRGFAEDARENLGYDLWRLENGEPPLDSKAIGAALSGVFELRDQDNDSWYRVLYTQIDGVIYVLHCFRKKSNKTSKVDIDMAERRLKALKERLRKEKKEPRVKG